MDASVFGRQRSACDGYRVLPCRKDGRMAVFTALLWTGHRLVSALRIYDAHQYHAGDNDILGANPHPNAHIGLCRPRIACRWRDYLPFRPGHLGIAAGTGTDLFRRDSSADRAWYVAGGILSPKSPAAVFNNDNNTRPGSTVEQREHESVSL